MLSTYIVAQSVVRRYKRALDSRLLQFIYLHFPAKKEAPKFVKKPENIECIESSDVSLEARVTGKPEPIVEWSENFYYFISL